MAGILTNAGTALIAKKQAKGEPLIITKFIFAYIAGLDITATPSLDESIPSADNIKFTGSVTKAGFVNPAQVVYSIIIGSDIGDWQYNWIGLQAEDGTLFAVVYIPAQQKVKNIPPNQIGNTITRNFLITYDSLQATTQITIPAEAWQFDITDTLNSMDERGRLATRAVFGPASFFKNGFKLIKDNGQFKLTAGEGIIQGIPIKQSAALTINPIGNQKVWLDVVLQKQGNIKQTILTIAYGDSISDYTDAAGNTHYLIKVAEIKDGVIYDYRRILPGDSLIESISNDPNDAPEAIASIAALQNLKDDLITNNNAINGNAILTKDQRGYICVSAATADTVITLPEANADNRGVEFILMRTDNSDHMLKVQAKGSDKILFHLNLNATGYSHFELFGAGDFWHIYATGDGTWLVMARNDASPIGVVNPIMTVTIPPSGYFPASRMSLAISRFPWLYDFVIASKVQTTLEKADSEPGKWVIDTSNNTILSPDLQGEFIRALDVNRGIDSDREAGSSQDHQIISHQHKQGSEALYNYFGGGKYIGGRSYPAGSSSSIQQALVSAFGGNETRPRNIAYLYIFKAI